jgi:hypothetical protein
MCNNFATGKGKERNAYLRTNTRVLDSRMENGIKKKRQVTGSWGRGPRRAIKTTTGGG